MSLVQDHDISKDPRNLSFLYPSMPLYKYKRATDKWYRLKCLRALEHMAAIMGLSVVPQDCIHWSKKKKYGDRRVEFLGRAYYVLRIEQLTKSELKRYTELTAGGENEE